MEPLEAPRFLDIFKDQNQHSEAPIHFLRFFCLCLFIISRILFFLPSMIFCWERRSCVSMDLEALVTYVSNLEILTVSDPAGNLLFAFLMALFAMTCLSAVWKTPACSQTTK